MCSCTRSGMHASAAHSVFAEARTSCDSSTRLARRGAPVRVGELGQPVENVHRAHGAHRQALAGETTRSLSCVEQVNSSRLVTAYPIHAEGVAIRCCISRGRRCSTRRLTWSEEAPDSVMPPRLQLEISCDVDSLDCRRVRPRTWQEGVQPSVTYFEDLEAFLGANGLRWDQAQPWGSSDRRPVTAVSPHDPRVVH